MIKTAIRSYFAPIATLITLVGAPVSAVALTGTDAFTSTDAVASTVASTVAFTSTDAVASTVASTDAVAHTSGAGSVVALARPVASGSASASGSADALFRLRDPRLDEISGIAAGIASPGVVYVHNDGGDSARFFALDARSGAVLAVYSVPGATNVDWEDIAVAPDADGTPSVWLADIGDNDASREQIRLYRVDEPHVDRAAHSLALTSSPAQAWRLRYPDGAHDAESLAVSPDGVPYIVTKSLLGASVVYAAPSRPAGVQVLREIGAIGFGITGTTTPFGPVGDLTATGADISRAGDRLVVRTYGDAYFFTIRNGDVAAALRTPPERVALPRQPQGEGICFDGNRVLVDSEKVGSAVYAVPTPPVTTPPTVTGRATSPTAAGPASARPSQATSASGADAGPADTSHTSGWWWVVVGAGFATAGAALAAVVRRRRETAGTP